MRAKDQTDEPAAVWVDIGDLTPWAANPRRNKTAVRSVASSIDEFGFGSPIVARRTGEIIAGHTRYAAAQLLGLEKVPVRYMDLSERDAHLLSLADNKIGEEAEWDNPELARILSDYSLEEAALAGWDQLELERLADEVPDFGPLEGEGGSGVTICPACGHEW